MKKLLLTFLVALFACISVYAEHHIDFAKIKHWTGTGSNQAALVVQYPASLDPHAYVWGFRWEDGENPTGEDMFKAICANSTELFILTQYTGQMGATLCGIGYGDADKMLDYIYFDFERAKDFEFINFDYYNVNTWFGQKDAPGDNTPAITAQAVQEAKTTHVIQHPIDAINYGYPAYDYDCWEMAAGAPQGSLWIAAWYEGYWSYWLTNKNSDEWLYSGVGFTGRMLENGAIDCWVYTPFDEPMIGGGDATGDVPTDNPDLISYRPASTMVSGISSVKADENYNIIEIYRLDGVRAATLQKGEEMSHLTKGIYLIKKGNNIQKIFIH